MKIQIEIPDWAKTRAIRIMAGIEQVAYKLPWEENWKIKVSRCSGCGACCRKLNCDKLIKEPGDNELYRCKDGTERPFLCCVSEPTTIDKCTSKYKEVKEL